jgi:transposase
VARRSFAVRDISEILIHWQVGRPIREIARSLNVDRKTIRKYVSLASKLGYRPGETRLSAQEWSAVLHQHAPQLVDPTTRSAVFTEIARFHEAIVAGLADNHPSTVWQRLHDEQGLRPSLRSFRRYLDHYLPDHLGRPQPTVLRDDPPPGQEAQIDFGYLGTWHDPVSAKRLRLWAFAMILSFSRHMFVYVVAKMDQQAWLDAHVAAFAFFGGVPLLLVIDNLKPGVLRADLYDPQINRGYEEMARYYGTLIDPCRKGHPKDKPRIERPIPYLRDSFFAGRSFGSLKEINEAAEKWCLSVAGERIHGTTRQRPLALFRQVEATALHPLPAQPFELATWTQAKVAPDCHIQVKGQLYSVPYRYIGKTLAVRLSATTVECYLDQTLVKTHVRLKEGRRQTDWNDYPEEKARFYQRTPDWCRAKATTLGPHVAQAVENLLDQHALHYLRQAQGIIGLGERYGHGRLNAACQRALAFGDHSYPTIKTILQKGLDGQLALPLGTNISAIAGAYLRGPEELFGSEPNHNHKEEHNG